MNVYTDVAFTISSGSLFQYDYSNAECMLAATGFTPLLVNLESMTSKPNAGGGSKDCVTWKVEEAVHNFLRADKVTAGSSTD